MYLRKYVRVFTQVHIFSISYTYLRAWNVSRKYVRVFTQVGCQFDTSTYGLKTQVRFSVNKLYVNTHGCSALAN